MGEGENLFSQADYQKTVETLANENVKSNQSSGAVVTALVLGILSIVLACANLIIPFVHLVAIGFGITAVTISSTKMRIKVKYSVGAFVTGLIGLIWGVIDVIIGVVAAGMLFS